MSYTRCVFKKWSVYVHKPENATLLSTVGDHFLRVIFFFMVHTGDLLRGGVLHAGPLATALLPLVSLTTGLTDGLSLTG